jgi:hypothetical protein
MNPKAVCLKAISVPPSTALRRYWMFEIAAYDRKSGPEISIRVGRLIART